MPLLQKENLEDHKNYRLVCLISVLVKVTGKKNHMETTSKLIKGTRNNQSRFVISKSSLTTVFAFSDELTISEWQEHAGSLSYQY